MMILSILLLNALMYTHDFCLVSDFLSYFANFKPLLIVYIVSGSPILARITDYVEPVPVQSIFKLDLTYGLASTKIMTNE